MGEFGGAESLHPISIWPMRFRAALWLILTSCATAKPVVDAAPATPQPVEAPAVAEDDLSSAFGNTEAPRAVKGQAPPPLADQRIPSTTR